MLTLEMFLAAIEALVKVGSNANRTLQHSNASQDPVFPTLKDCNLAWLRRCAQWLAIEVGSLWPNVQGEGNGSERSGCQVEGVRRRSGKLRLVGGNSAMSGGGIDTDVSLRR